MDKLTFICIVSLLINCANTIQFVKFPNQSVDIDDSTKSRIYVYRPAGIGNGISISIISGNKLIGTTGTNGYLCWEEKPGQTKIIAKAENTDSINFLAISGQQYYIKQFMNMGVLYATNKLALVQKKEARIEIVSCSKPELSPEPISTEKNNTIKQSPTNVGDTSIQKLSENDHKIIEQTHRKNTNLGVVLLLLSLGLAITSLVFFL